MSQLTVHDDFIDHLRVELARRDPDGAMLGRVADVGLAAVVAADAALDSAHLWVEQLGAFYDTDGVRSLLGAPGTPVSRQAVHQRRGLLALRTRSGAVVYPALQFRGRTLIGGLAVVLDALPASLVSPWTVASWLTTPTVDLHGEAPIDVLAEGGPCGQGRVARLASAWAARLAT